MTKNLLFDLGGVIMEIRRQRCVDAFKRLGMADPDSLLGEYVQKGPFKLIEEGAISAPEWRLEMRKWLPEGVTDSQIDEAFIEFLVGIPVERLRHLEQLHKRFAIYMLSNTNPVMWDSKIADEFTHDGRNREFYFDGILTSFEAKVMKPDPGIFKIAIEKFGIVPEETIFLDDSQANLDSAARLGFKTALVEPGTEFYNLECLR